MDYVRANIKVKGIVQGVGFRPFIHKLVLDAGLAGWIRNTNSGAEIEVEGDMDAIESFIADIRDKAPLLAAVEDIETIFPNDLKMYHGFKIIESESKGKRRTLISPDVAVCPDCLRELMDRKDRRYRYPFINCTNCGPRFTIIRNIPYDRKNTTMAEFEMCPECAAEYGNIENRRYHAQPDCCPKCGPELTFLDGEGNPAQIKPKVEKVLVTDEGAKVIERTGGGPIEHAIDALAQGSIVAVKGLGGFHLAARADDAKIAKRLRERKQRDEKPFAIMCRDVDTARRYAKVSEDEAKALESYRRPIVLLKKHDRSDYPYLSENGYIGIMLPYTPVHYLLFGGEIDSLIMTSANLSDLPIIYENDRALTELKGIADYFLTHDRKIETRCDDSLQWIIGGREYPVRRSRGYVPYPLRLAGADGILACGAEQKASFSIAADGYVFPSQHMGDLKNIETYENYERQIIHFEKLFDAETRYIACDLHPDFMSTDLAVRRAEEENLKLIKVQHHHAHMASCMADNYLEGKCIGVIWDGTGLGTDGTIWGGEFLVGDFRSYRRAGHMQPVRLPGGDAAAKEIWRIAMSLLEDSGISSSGMFKGDRADRVRQMLKSGINSPYSSGLGRLFDGISALCGIKHEANYEGQGAVLLEAAAGETEETYPYIINKVRVDAVQSPLMEEAGEEISTSKYVIETETMIKSIYEDVLADKDNSYIAAGFMNTLVSAAAEMCARIRDDTGLNRVVLSGGSFQNMYLLKNLSSMLKDAGFEVFRHSRVSCNDEGLSFGQCAVAAARKGEMGNVSGSSSDDKRDQ